MPRITGMVLRIEMKKLVSKIVRLNGMKMITQLICARVKQKKII